MKWWERRKLTGCGNIDNTKGLYEMYQGAVSAGTDLDIMFNCYLTTTHIIISPERKER